MDSYAAKMIAWDKIITEKKHREFIEEGERSAVSNDEPICVLSSLIPDYLELCRLQLTDIDKVYHQFFNQKGDNSVKSLSDKLLSDNFVGDQQPENEYGYGLYCTLGSAFAVTTILRDTISLIGRRGVNHQLWDVMFMPFEFDKIINLEEKITEWEQLPTALSKELYDNLRPLINRPLVPITMLKDALVNFMQFHEIVVPVEKLLPICLDEIVWNFSVDVKAEQVNLNVAMFEMYKRPNGVGMTCDFEIHLRESAEKLQDEYNHCKYPLIAIARILAICKYANENDYAFSIV